MEEEEDNNQKITKILLASSSPRRKRILKQLNLNFEAFCPEGITEKVYKNPRKTVKFNSLLKAQFVYNNVIINSLNYKDSIVAGFDTLVYFDGQHIGKPADVLQAEYFLGKLSGKNHLVLTGISLIDCNTGRTVTGIDVTRVKFRKLNSVEIKNYLKNEEVLDKAGAYDISGFGSILVEKIRGCFYNVAGFPVHKFIELAAELNYSIL